MSTSSSSEQRVGQELSRAAAQVRAVAAAGRFDEIAPEALQDALSALVGAYVAKLESPHAPAFLPVDDSVTATEAMVTAAGLLRAADVELFELGMWQTWGSLGEQEG